MHCPSCTTLETTTQMACIEQQSCDFCVEILITIRFSQREHPRYNEPVPLSNGVTFSTCMARGNDMTLTKHRENSDFANQKCHDAIRSILFSILCYHHNLLLATMLAKAVLSIRLLLFSDYIATSRNMVPLLNADVVLGNPLMSLGLRFNFWG